MASTLLPVLALFAVAAVIAYYLKKKGIILKEKKQLPYAVSYNPEDPDHRPPYSAQSSTNGTSGTLYAIKFNKLCQPIAGMFMSRISRRITISFNTRDVYTSLRSRKS